MNNHVAFGSFNLKISRLADLAGRFGYQLCPEVFHYGSDSTINHISVKGIVFLRLTSVALPNFTTLDMAGHSKTKF